MLRIGCVLDGKYKILNEIGHGGMSVVYLAVNERANKTWAVKEVRKGGMNDSEVVCRGLAAETEMLKKLRHPNLPGIIDVIDTDDSFIIVMDYIEGRSLQDLLDQSGAQDPELVIGWARQLCDVLGYLHSRQPPIIYRDMKPANIMLKPDGHVVLIDFGAAREYKAGSTGDTTWLGTRGYAAPEQFGGRGQTDARTDIYNLGATMYHLLTGLSPADTRFVILPAGKLRPELSGSGIEKVVSCCCRPDPDERYRSCAELMYALEHVHDEDIQAVRKRNRRWQVFVGSAAVMLAGIIGMAGFGLAKMKAVRSSYSTYISQAPGSPDLAGKINRYKAAIDLKPGAAEAYGRMLEDFFSDGVISRDEKAGIEACLNSTGRRPAGKGSNLMYFKKHNAAGFAMFELVLGQDYFIGYEAGGKTDAYNAFASALDSGGLPDGSDSERIAASLRKLTEYYGALRPADSGRAWAYGDTGGRGYKDFWDGFAEYVMHPESIDGKSGGEGLSAAIYRECATQISINAGKFVTAGVAVRDMKAAMEQAERYLDRFFEKKPYSEAVYAGGDDSSRHVVLNCVSAVEKAKETLSGMDNTSYALKNSK